MDYLVFQIINQLRIFPIFASQRFLQLENRRIQLDCPVSLEDIPDGLESFRPDRHLKRIEIPSSLCQFGFPVRVVLLFCQRVDFGRQLRVVERGLEKREEVRFGGKSFRRWELV